MNIDTCFHCQYCARCRVPGDLPRLERVCGRLEREGRQDHLVERLHSYLDSEQCPVATGCVDLR